LAHPEHNGYVTPFTFEERLQHVAEAKRTLGTNVPWLVDGMDNRVKHAFGDRPNSEFVIDPQGKIVRKRAWSDPEALRRDLEQLVGPVAKPTRIAELDLKASPPPKAAAKGVVPRLPLPPDFRPLKVEPQSGNEGSVFYAKLRAEADSNLIRTGTGKLYLGIHLDPIYRVHWNNLTKPVRITVETPEGVHVNSKTMEGPKVKEPVDIDPREFLIEVRGEPTHAPFHVAVSYFACNDEESWCKAIAQEYAVYLQEDRDAGRVQRRGQAPSDRARTAKTGARTATAAANVIMGRITTVDVGRTAITVRSRDGQIVALGVPESAELTKNGAACSLQDLRIGERVRLQFDRQSKDRLVVRRLASRSES
jgi:hypothetical protein